MEYGIFETVFNRPTLGETLKSVSEAGFSSVQFHFESAGVDPSLGPVSSEAASTIIELSRSCGVRLPAVSGTYNMAHPEPSVRAAGLEGFTRLVAGASAIGATFVTVCTGTRSRESMWHYHPDNASLAAWSDMVESVLAALEVAEKYGITLVVEPEPANIVSSARRARELLDHVAHPQLKIVLDPANIVLSDRSRTPEVVLAESFDLLGPDIVFAHAKDLDASDEFCAAGRGIVPWPLYWELLKGIGYCGDVIFHTLSEDDLDLAWSIVPVHAS
jgi:sugar phosphate isomerase/epimerase